MAHSTASHAGHAGALKRRHRPSPAERTDGPRPLKLRAQNGPSPASQHPCPQRPRDAGNGPRAKGARTASMHALPGQRDTASFLTGFVSGSRHEAPPPPRFWERLTTGPQHAHVPRAGRGATWTHSVVSTRKTRWYHTYAECVHLDLQVSNGPENHHVGGRLWLRRLGTEGVLRASRLEGSSLRPAGVLKGLRLWNHPRTVLVRGGTAPSDLTDTGRSDDLRDLRLDLESHRTASPAGAPRGTREGHREHEGRVRAG